MDQKFSRTRRRAFANWSINSVSSSGECVQFMKAPCVLEKFAEGCPACEMADFWFEALRTDEHKQEP